MSNLLDLGDFYQRNEEWRLWVVLEVGKRYRFDYGLHSVSGTVVSKSYHNEIYLKDHTSNYPKQLFRIDISVGMKIHHA